MDPKLQRDDCFASTNRSSNCTPGIQGDGAQSFRLHGPLAGSARSRKIPTLRRNNAISFANVTRVIRTAASMVSPIPSNDKPRRRVAVIITLSGGRISPRGRCIVRNGHGGKAGVYVRGEVDPFKKDHPRICC